MLTPEIGLSGSVSYIKLLKFHSNDPSQAALLLNVPDLKFKASVTLQNLLVKNSFLRLFGRYQKAFEFRSGRWNSGLFYEDGKVPARFVADLGLGYNFSNGLGLSANVFNLLGDKGVDVLGAPQGGRMAYVQLAYKYDGLAF
jgi:iron complex outermembrane receptor protein